MFDDETRYIAQITAKIDLERKLLKEQKFAEYERVIEAGNDAEDVKHAKLCKSLWCQGQRQHALSSVIERLRSGSYSILHVFQAAEYAIALRDISAGHFLREFVSKFDEISSKAFVSYASKLLAGEKPLAEEIAQVIALYGPRKEAAWSRHEMSQKA